MLRWKTFSASIPEWIWRKHSREATSADETTISSSATKKRKPPDANLPRLVETLLATSWRGRWGSSRKRETLRATSLRLVIQILHGFLHFRGERSQVVAFQANRGDRLAHAHFQRTALNMKSIHREQFVSSDQGHGNDIHLGLDR